MRFMHPQKQRSKLLHFVSTSQDVADSQAALMAGLPPEIFRRFVYGGSTSPYRAACHVFIDLLYSCLRCNIM
jgi:hypothetical protein